MSKILTRIPRWNQCHGCSTPFRPMFVLVKDNMNNYMGYVGIVHIDPRDDNNEHMRAKLAHDVIRGGTLLTLERAQFEFPDLLDLDKFSYLGPKKR